MNATSELKLRAARAEDADAAVPLIYSAAPEAFDYMLRAAGREAQDFLRHAYRDGAGFQGWRNHRVVERDGVAVGIGAFYSGRDELRLSLGMVRQVLGFYPLGAALGVIARSLHVAPMMKPLTRDMLYVANLGTASSDRGQGIGSHLLREQIQHARHRGLRRFALDVAQTNPRAQKLYERLGLKPIKETYFKGDRQRSPVPDSRRLELQLDENI